MPETVTISILGQPVTLRSETPRERLHLIAQLVDERTQEIRQALPTISPIEVAIMAALNLAYDYLEVKEEYQRLQREIETKSQRLIQLIETRSSLPLRCS